MVEVYLGLGSNLGDRQSLLSKAIGLLEESGCFSDVRISSFYETAPWGVLDQPAFLNAVFTGRTNLSPRQTLEMCQTIEKELDRVRTLRWGPRTIDVDILIFGKEMQNEPDLVIPHPRLFERAFALLPLAEVCSEEIECYYQISAYAAAVSDQDVRML